MEKSWAARLQHGCIDGGLLSQRVLPADDLSKDCIHSLYIVYSCVFCSASSRLFGPFWIFIATHDLSM